MPLARLQIPGLVVHHEQDGCAHCRFSDIPALMSRLDHLPRKELLTFKGGDSRSNPFEAMAYHGFNGLEREVVARIAAWIVAK